MSFRTVEIPENCKVALVSDQLVERLRAESDEDGWSPARTVQVRVPPADGRVIDPQFRYVGDPTRAAVHEMLYEALLRWNVDSEIGSSAALAEWVDEYLSGALA